MSASYGLTAAQSTFLGNLNSSANMITVFTEMLLLSTGHWRVNPRNPKDAVVAMIHFGMAGTVFSWSKSLWAPTPTCTNAILAFCADFLWSFKDSLKYFYLLYRSLIVAFPEKQHQPRILAMSAFAGLLSLSFYYAYMGQYYVFNTPNCQLPSTVIVTAQYYMYIYWTCIDITSGLLVLKTLIQYALQFKSFKSSSALYTDLAAREAIRILFCGLPMIIVTILAAMKMNHPDYYKSLVTMNVFIFNFIQGLLVSVVWNKPRTIGNNTSTAVPNSKAHPSGKQASNAPPALTNVLPRGDKVTPSPPE